MRKELMIMSNAFFFLNLKSSNLLTLLLFCSYSLLGFSQIISKNGVPVDKPDKRLEKTALNIENKNYSIGQNLIIESIQISKKVTKLDSINYSLILNNKNNNYQLLIFYDKLKGTSIDLVQARILDSLFVDFYLKPEISPFDHCLTCINEKCFSFSGFNLEVFNNKLALDTIIKIPKGESFEAHVFHIGLDVYKNRYLFLGTNYIDRKQKKYFQRVLIFDTQILSFIHKQDFYSNYATFGELAIVDDFLYLKKIVNNYQNVCFLKYKITL